MSKAKAGLRGLNGVQKAEKASTIYTGMLNNPHFPDPVPSMVEFAQAIEQLKEANIAALDRGRIAIARRNSAEQEISTMITRLAGYVNSVSLGDAEKILSAGFDLVKRPEPISQLPAPRSATVVATPIPERLLLRWKRVPGAVMYQVDEAVGGTEDGPDWKLLDIVTDHRMEINGHDKRGSYRFRLRALGTRVKGPYTTAIYQVAA